MNPKPIELMIIKRIPTKRLIFLFISDHSIADNLINRMSCLYFLRDFYVKKILSKKVVIKPISFGDLHLDK